MKIAKEFNWEMGHRLPEHFGKCKNIHGHSYKLLVEFEGSINSNGMVLDYYDMKSLINPIIEKLDHSFLVYREDKEVLDFLQKINSKIVVVDFQSTVENICTYLLNEITKHNLPSNIYSVKIKVCETPDDYAEDSKNIR